MKISQVFKHFKGRKGSQVERRRGRRRERGAKGVALQTSPSTCRYPGVMGLYPGPPEKGGLELGPTRNQTRTEPEFEFSAKRRWPVSNPQLKFRTFNQIPASRTGRLEKQGRMLARGILGSGRTRGVSFWPFPNSSSWWWLISSIFLTRISCHKTTHANGH